MQVKICGMREATNLGEITGLAPAFVGFIFYAKSSRYVADALDTALLRSLPPQVRKVGVFVDADLPEVLATTTRYGLDYVQLHGHETPTYCQAAHAHGLRIIKAFSVGDSFDFSTLAAYAPYCELFLFDTKGAQPGGNGTAFDWSILADYQGPIPFLLSGGLGLNNVAELRQFQHPQLVGYDFNSQLETAPALKDVAATRQLLTQLHAQPTPTF
jgi:phosphoribosylanthranilate isomerase